MSGWDEGAVYYSEAAQLAGKSEGEGSKHSVVLKLKEFIRGFESEKNVYPYRESLLKNQTSLVVDIEHLDAFDPDLPPFLRSSPSEFLPLFETAASEVLTSFKSKLPDEIDDDEAKKNNQRQSSKMAQDSDSSADSTVTQDPFDVESIADLCLRPYAVIIANIPTPKYDDNYGALGEYLQDYLDVDVERVISIWRIGSAIGYAIVEFGSSPTACKAAVRLERTFENEAHGKEQWYETGEKNGIYLWLARPADADMFTHHIVRYHTFDIPKLWKLQARKAADNDERRVYRKIRLYAARYEFVRLGN